MHYPFHLFLHLLHHSLFLLFFNLSQCLHCDFTNNSNKDSCAWEISGNFIISSSLNGSSNNTNGYFLLFKPKINDHYETTDNGNILIASLKSPILGSSDIQNSLCTLKIDLNTGEFDHGMVRIIVHTIDKKFPDFEINKVRGNNLKSWQRYPFSIGEVHAGSYQLFVEIVADNLNSITSDTYIAIDNLDLVNCDEKTKPHEGQCSFKCPSNGACISRDKICDLQNDCPNGEDELQSCEKLPKGSYCSFTNGDFCNWENVGHSYDTDSGEWTIESDNNDWFVTAKFPNKHMFGRTAGIKSPTFDSVPLYHSLQQSSYFNMCLVRFLYLFVSSSSEIRLVLLEKNPRYHHTGRAIELWREFSTSVSSRTRTATWTRVSIPLPHNISYEYNLEFTATSGMRGSSTAPRNRQIIALDNISLSKECFGIDVPENETRKVQNTQHEITMHSLSHSFVIPSNITHLHYKFTTCGSSGRVGPSYADCDTSYRNTSTNVAVIQSPVSRWNGTQLWTVPKSGIYSVFARGGSGGNGTRGSGGRGSIVRAVFNWQEGDTIFILIGQSGTSACRKDLDSKLLIQCQNKREKRNILQLSKVVKNIGGGGGGGGATYVFKLEPRHDGVPDRPVPLLIASGGGGGGGTNDVQMDTPSINGQNGRGIYTDNDGNSGIGEGAGGGWRRVANNSTMGQYVCGDAKQWDTNGGFGGGGGGCTSGGGGGGYQGGDSVTKGLGGHGGTSYINRNYGFLPLVNDDTENGYNFKEIEGTVVIVAQIEYCCDHQYPCAVISQSDTEDVITHCICPNGMFHQHTCHGLGEAFASGISLQFIIIALFIIILIIGVSIFTVIYITKYRKTCPNNTRVGGDQLVGRDASVSQLLSNSSTDVQLSRLRNGHNIITEYNPNYEFGGSTCTLQDLREIPREKLTLIKALGQGAFGEVYQGFLHNMPGEITDELPVAVKTLPEYSANNQAEMDFLMEALIMSKFKHRNIVRFIGVCFEKMPRFIVLELLSGGDLKTFLRESRGTSARPSLLSMGDLLVMALDVARGCQYLEENHFIHRDIAARNCLLTNKAKIPNGTVNVMNGCFNMNNYNNGFNSSGIVVKIADFGMARDIYRADYYRKGGKAMLPVKWMPPEAFLDGIFTAKTDVWSFGVLLWEVMSMGYMPYPGRGNQEVMQLVTAGGRLESPNPSTPPQVFAIMTQCWNPAPDQRPAFSTIIERIGYCLQDPDVLSVPLPVFHRAPSMERDITLMRPPPDTTDYLIPNNPCSNSNSNYSMSTEKTELLSPDSCSTFSCTNEENAKLLELMDESTPPPVIPPRTCNWRETAFSNRPAGYGQNDLTQKPDDGLKTKPNLTNSNQQSSGQQSSLLLDAAALLQQPSRYVNVNVDNSDLNANSAVRLNQQQINC